MNDPIVRNRQYARFCAYGFLKNLRFFEAFLILFLLEKGLSFSRIGILYALREISINLFEIPSGIIADTWGRKQSLIGSLLLYILSFLTFYFFSSFWFFVPAVILYGMGDAFRSGTHKGIILDYLRIHHREDHMSEYYGHTRSWSQIGSALSSLIAGMIIFYGGTYQGIFLYTVAPYLLNLINLSTYPDIPRKIPEAKGKQAGIISTAGNLIRVIRRRDVQDILTTTALHTAFLKALKDYIQPLMLQTALLLPAAAVITADQQNGLFIGIVYFLIYMLTSGASRLSARIPAGHRKRLVRLTLPAGLLAGFLCGLFFSFSLALPALLFFILVFLNENLRKPVLTGFMAEHVPQEILTSVMSAQSQVKTVFTALLALVFGAIADTWGLGVSFMVTSGSLLLLVCLLTLSITGKRRDSE